MRADTRRDHLVTDHCRYGRDIFFYLRMLRSCGTLLVKFRHVRLWSGGPMVQAVFVFLIFTKLWVTQVRSTTIAEHQHDRHDYQWLRQTG